MANKLPSEIPFSQVLQALRNEDDPFPPRYLYRFSDLNDKDLAALKKEWPHVSDWRRQAIMEDLEELGESDPLLTFDSVAQMAIRQDPDTNVRTPAVRILWETEDKNLVPFFIALLQKDESAEVRAASATGLSKYIYLGEIEELPEKTLHEIEGTLLQATHDRETLVQRRALEALGFSSRKEVPPLIEAAFSRGEKDWLVTALFAMGRSANERWTSQVMSMLPNPQAEVRAEAARAAGELELSEATPILMALLEDEDPEVRMASVWSLSQLGGDGVRERLEQLQEQTDDEDEADFIEDALDNLSFTEEIGMFGIFDVDEEDENE